MDHGKLKLAIHSAYERANPIITGTVLAVPGRLEYDTLSQPYDADVILAPGDKVWFHHNMIIENQMIEPGAYWMYYEAIYAAKRGEEFFCVGDTLLVDAQVESEDDIKTSSGIFFKANPEEKYLRGTVRHLGIPRKKEREWFNLQVGDLIIFDEDSEIPLVIDGHRYFRQKFDDVLAIYSGDSFFVQGGWVAVRPAPRETVTSFGLIIPDVVKHRPSKGEVVGCRGSGAVGTGDIVYFPKGMGTVVEDLLYLHETDLMLVQCYDPSFSNSGTSGSVMAEHSGM